MRASLFKSAFRNPKSAFRTARRVIIRRKFFRTPSKRRSTRGPMPRRADFSAELILVCNSLEAGGIERVVSTLANEWSRRGRRVCVVTMPDRRRFFELDPRVRHVVIDRAGVTWIAELVRRAGVLLERLAGVKSALRSLLGQRLYHFLAMKVWSVNFSLYLAYEAWALRRALGRIESPVAVSLGTYVNVITL